MKTLRPLLFLPLALLASARGAGAVESAITAVTVYADRAVVTRTAAVELAAGSHELVFAHLPESLQDQSLQVSGRGTATATILDVGARRTFVSFTPNERVKALEDQLKGLQRQMRGLDDRAKVLDEQAGMLQQMQAALFAPPAKDVPRPELAQFTTAMNFLTEQATRITADRTALDLQREELQRQVDAVAAQLNQLRGAGGRAYKTVTVRVAAAAAGRLDLTLAYTVPGASWAPSYDARVLAAERAVQLGYFGLVRQNTGEDWKEVQLTLSTARPSLGGSAPDLGPWSLDVFVAVPLQEAGRPRARREAFPMAMATAAGAATDMAEPPAPEEKDAPLAQAAVEAGATSATFKIAAASTVPSDNSPQRVPITSARLNAQSEYATVPKRQPVAFLTSRVFNNTEFPLLAGAMNVFLDGTFVATSRLKTVMPGERFELALGADDGIAVTHKRVQKFTEDTGLISSGKRITYEYLLTIQNNKRTAERVIVTDQVPVSRNEKIVVKQLSPSPSEVKPDKDGLLKWTLDLKPGEKRELTVKFTVDHPNDINVAGLE